MNFLEAPSNVVIIEAALGVVVWTVAIEGGGGNEGRSVHLS